MQSSDDRSVTELSAQPMVLTAGPATRFAACVILVGIADILLYRQEIGWTLGGVSLAVLCSAALLNPHAVACARGKVLFLLTSGLCFAIADHPQGLTIAMLLLTLISFSIAHSEEAFASVRKWIEGLGRFVFQNAISLLSDIGGILSDGPGGGRALVVRTVGRWWLALISVPVFAALFVWANPVIEFWIRNVPWPELRSAASPLRILFWLLAAQIIWLFVQPRLRWPSSIPRRQPESAPVLLITPAAAIRALLLLNVMFGIQNSLDAEFLWGRRELPEGLTFANYAHRGVGALTLAGVLAAALVVLAFRSSLESFQPRAARYSLYVWMAQSVIVAASALSRMLLYVEAYSLTHMRVAGLLGIGLVVVGLIIVAFGVGRARTNVWMMNANAIALGVTLYFLCFVDLGRVVADFNVRRCHELGGPGPVLDVNHMATIGPSALPALRWYVARASAPSSQTTHLIARYAAELAAVQADWRSWTYRAHRLLHSPVKSGG